MGMSVAIIMFSAAIMCVGAVCALRGADRKKAGKITVACTGGAESTELLLRYAYSLAGNFDVVLFCEPSGEAEEICRRFFRDKGCLEIIFSVPTAPKRQQPPPPPH